MEMLSAPKFHVIPGPVVKSVINNNKKQIFDAVEAAYRLHASGESVNPHSSFLRYPDKPSARIIALPAHLAAPIKRSGIKWVASFPENIGSNLARASAVQILNDSETGYPLACLEASSTSAARTAASAALAAEHMSPLPFKGTLCVVGTGVIARTTLEWLFFRNWNFQEVNLYDLKRAEAEQFAKWLRSGHDQKVEVKDSLAEAVQGATLVLFTTTAQSPYLNNPELFAHAPTVVHLSLRDIDVNVILKSQNIVDDVEHCLRANTSLHLTEQATGNRDFIAGNLVAVMDKRVALELDRARIFSPFGLGCLDLAVCDFVFREAVLTNKTVEVPDFFANSARW
jgi:N-[(2S)-2-amino-2-carboxyethyl]-L-glutamate dehydrogenase